MEQALPMGRPPARRPVRMERKLVLPQMGRGTGVIERTLHMVVRRPKTVVRMLEMGPRVERIPVSWLH